MMILHENITDAALRSKIRSKAINFGGNARLKIYGLPGCRSGKHMHRANRVFFRTAGEAEANGYRPLRALFKTGL